MNNWLRTHGDGNCLLTATPSKGHLNEIKPSKIIEKLSNNTSIYNKEVAGNSLNTIPLRNMMNLFTQQPRILSEINMKCITENTIIESCTKLKD